MKYMGDSPTGVEADVIATDLLSRAHSMPEIRDEIYCQICKQINHNPRRSSLQRGLELLGVSFILSIFFSLGLILVFVIRQL
jgi:hypothetical protein